MKNKTFYSNGKLLISGEYIVLDGAKSLAIPTKYGQYLIVEPIEENRLFWKSFDEQNKLWYQGEFSIKDNSIECFDANEVSQRLEFANLPCGHHLERFQRRRKKARPHRFHQEQLVFSCELH